MTTTVHVTGASPLDGSVCRVIAEAGANHNNSVERAIEMAVAARDAGAWAIKYQLYKADRLATKDAPKYWEDDIGTSSQHDAYVLSDHLDYSDYGPIAQACRDLGIVFFATPFDDDAVDALESMGVPLYKIASADITHRPLIESVASTGKPILLSTGAATADEIERAIEWSGYGPDKLVVLVCTLTYPTPDDDGHFARIATMAARFAPFLVGTSDHTLGTAGAWMSAALGAACIEKHYTLDPGLPDVPDHAMSVDPIQLGEMVRICEQASTLRGSAALEVHESERPARLYARRSIVVERAVAAGETIERDHLAFKRPGIGMEPNEVDTVVGRRAKLAIASGTLLSADLLD